LVLTNKYYEGTVPKRGELTTEDKELLAKIGETKSKVEDLMYRYKIREAQNEVMNLARAGNKYLADNEPWKLVKTDPVRVETIMNLALEITANISVLLAPFLPKSANKIASFLNIDNSQWANVGTEDFMKTGGTINKPEILFQKIDDAFVEAELAKLQASKKVEPTYDPVKDEIQFDDFVNMDIRIGEIVAAEKIKKANKLLQLQVDLGFETRTIVSGIAEHYTPEDVIGKKVSVLLNLAPRKIRGVESNGMILMAENPDGELAFVSPEKAIVNGAGVR
jgi:methionyl-tRNA synthetase